MGLANNAQHAAPTGYTAAQAVFSATATAIFVGDYALSDRLLGTWLTGEIKTQTE